VHRFAQRNLPGAARAAAPTTRCRP
jgi:hypothetical protein